MIGRAKKNHSHTSFSFLIVVKKISRITDNRIFKNHSIFRVKREIPYINPIIFFREIKFDEKFREIDFTKKKFFLNNSYSYAPLRFMLQIFHTNDNLFYKNHSHILFSYYKVIMNTFHFGPNHLFFVKSISRIFS